MNHLDLFSGIGGFSLGLKKVFDIKHTYYSEIDKYAIDVYKNNFKNITYVKSVTDVRGGELPGIDIITFGSPCQDFSMAGKRKGMAGARSSLISEAIRLIEECRPSFFIWENVKGTFSSNNGADFWAIIQAFTNIGGYRLEWQLLNTKWFLPQNRERIYLVGCLGKGSGQQIFPITESNRKINDIQRQQGNTCTLTTRYEAGGNGSYIIKRELNAQKVIKPTQLGQSTQTYAYKNGTINIEEYREGIKRLDFVFDVLSVRKQIFGDEKSANGKFKYMGGFGAVPKGEEKKEAESGNVFSETINKIGSGIGMFD